MLSPAALAGRLDAALAEDAGDPAPAACWRRAWALTAQGRYGAALAALAAAEGDADLAPRAHATRAALLRQLGLHHRAEADDRAGLALTADGSASAAVVAALRIGVVADGVGQGAGDLDARLGAARRACAATADWRQHVRLAWVEGEVAMVGHRWDDALAAFTAAAAAAARRGARRHVAKAALFAAAATAAAGDRDGARAGAEQARAHAAACGAAPLCWAAELVLADTAADDASAAAHLARAAAGFSDLVAGLPAPDQAEVRTGALGWLLAGASA